MKDLMEIYDFSGTDKIIRFAVGTTVGTTQMITSDTKMYEDTCLQLLPMVSWENNMVLPFSSQEVPPATSRSSTQNYGLVFLPEYYQIDRVQANIGGNINIIVQKVDGNTFFNYAQSYVSTYPSIFWWNNLDQNVYLYPIPTGCIIKVFGRKLLCETKKRIVDNVEIDYPWLNLDLLKPYIFEFIGYSLAKALHIYYNLPWSPAKDSNLDNLQELLLNKQEQSFIAKKYGPQLNIGKPMQPGSIFTLGKPFNG